MSDVEQRPAGGGTNPNFTATAFFPSGLNASGPVDVASAFAASGLEASAMIKGTIGEFLATALAGSGFDASGPSKFTTMSGTDLEISTINGAPPGTTTSTFTSGITTCALASIAATAIFTSAFSALDIEVSTINGAPPGTTTSTFTSGITTCALASIGASLIVDGSATFGALASFNASVTFASGGNFSGPVTASSASILTATTSTLTACTLLSVGGSAVFTSGFNASAAANMTTGSFQTVNASTATVSALLSAQNIMASTETITAFLSVGIVGARFNNVVSITNDTYVTTTVHANVLLYNTLQDHGLTVSASFTIATLSSPLLVNTSIPGSAIAITLISAGTAAVSGTFLDIEKIDGTANSVVVVAATGDTIEGLSQVNTNVQFGKFRLYSDGSATWHNYLSADVNSALFQSGGTFSGLVSATSFVGQFAFVSVDAPSGGTFSGLLSQGASVLIGCTLAVSGLTSLGGSLAVASGINSSGPIVVTSGAFQSGIGGSAAQTLVIFGNISAANASVNVGCALVVSGPIMIAGLASLYHSAGGFALMSLALLTGIQGPSYWIQASVGNTNQWLITVSGFMCMPGINVSTLSALDVQTSTLTASTETVNVLLSVAGSVLGQSGATFSGLVSATSFAGAFAFTSVDAASGGTLSALLSVEASVLVACTLAVSGLASLGGSAIVASTLAVSGPTLLEAPSTTVDFTILMATGQNVANIIVSGVVGGPGQIYQLDQSGNETLVGHLSAASALIGCVLAVSGLASLGGSANVTNVLTVSGLTSIGACALVTCAFVGQGQIVLNVASQTASAAGGTLMCIVTCVGAQLTNFIKISANGVVLFALDASGDLTAASRNASFNNVFANGNLVTVASVQVFSGLVNSVGAQFYLQGPVQYPPIITSVSITLAAASTRPILVNTSIGGSNVTVTLPSAAKVSGAFITVIKIDASAATALVAAATGDTIEGVSLIGSNNTTQFGKFNLYSAGSVTWYNTGSGLV